MRGEGESHRSYHPGVVAAISITLSLPPQSIVTALASPVYKETKVGLVATSREAIAMIMADVFKILFLVLGTLTTIVSYWLLFEAMVPRMVEAARQAYEQRLRRTLWVGLLVVLPGLVVGFSLANAPVALLKLLGVTMLMLLALMGLMGSAGLTRLLGQRLPSPDDETYPWRRVLRGGIVLAICFVLPLIGWFLVLPITLVTGVGATVRAYSRIRREARQTELVAAGGTVDA